MDLIMELKKYLSQMEPGPISGSEEKTIQKHLAELWDDLEGGSDHSMASHKLDRTKSMTISPPNKFNLRLRGMGGPV